MGFWSAMAGIAGDYIGQYANWKAQTQFNRTERRREDSAVQRRAKDLEAAGLSKNLAAGSAAVAGGSPSAPSVSTDPQFMNALVDMKLKNRQVDRTAAETSLLKAKESETRENTAWIDSYKKAQVDLMVQEYNYKKVLNPVNIGAIINKNREINSRVGLIKAQKDKIRQAIEFGVDRQEVEMQYQALKNKQIGGEIDRDAKNDDLKMAAIDAAIQLKKKQQEYLGQRIRSGAAQTSRKSAGDRAVDTLQYWFGD